MKKISKNAFEPIDQEEKELMESIERGEGRRCIESTRPFFNRLDENSIWTGIDILSIS